MADSKEYGSKRRGANDGRGVGASTEQPSAQVSYHRFELQNVFSVADSKEYGSKRQRTTDNGGVGASTEQASTQVSCHQSRLRQQAKKIRE